MKLSRLFNNLPKRLAAGALVAIAVTLPVAASAADMVHESATMGVANVTAGDTTYGQSVSAKYNEVVKVEVTYDNNEDPSSTKTTNNIHVKFNIPSGSGVSQTISSSVTADNINPINNSVKVNLDGKDAYLQYIPGTAEWKHATVSNNKLDSTANVVEQKISDDAVTNPNGINLGTENPCQAGSVAISVGVVVPGVSVDKYVRESGSSNWTTSITAKSGDAIQYEIAYHNTGNTTEKNVEFRDQLPKGITYVPGSTKLKNGNYPNGTPISSDAVVTDGILTGDYAPGAAGYVLFDAKVADESLLTCGANQMRNIAYVQPQGMNYYYNTADVNVNKVCTPNQPSYACTAFHVTVGDNRTVKVDAFNFSASDNSSLTSVALNWGDSSAALVTNNVVGQSHTFSQDGNYTISLSQFMVNGKAVDVTGNCTQTVSFTTPGTTTVTELPNTGAGNVVAIAFGAVAAGTIAGRLFLSRKLARKV